MTDGDLDPVIHVPARLRIMVTLATLAEGDHLSFPRLQQLLDLTPGNLITHLRKLEATGYVRSGKPDGQSALYLTHAGRAALDRYTENLRRLLDQVSPPAGGLAKRRLGRAGRVRAPRCRALRRADFAFAYLMTTQGAFA